MKKISKILLIVIMGIMNFSMCAALDFRYSSVNKMLPMNKVVWCVILILIGLLPAFTCISKFANKTTPNTPAYKHIFSGVGCLLSDLSIEFGFLFVFWLICEINANNLWWLVVFFAFLGIGLLQEFITGILQRIYIIFKR